MIRFKIFDVEVKISFIFIFFISWLLIYNNNSRIVLICIFSSIFHETMHLLILAIFYAKPKIVTFTSYGISIKKETELTYAKEIILLVSGCVGNLMLLTVSVIFNLKILAIVNICLLIFNMLPAEKLDGGQIFSLIASKLFNYETYSKVTRTVFFCSQIFILLISILMFKFFNNMTLLISFIIFIFSFIIGEI